MLAGHIEWPRSRASVKQPRRPKGFGLRHLVMILVALLPGGMVGMFTLYAIMGKENWRRDSLLITGLALLPAGLLIALRWPDFPQTDSEFGGQNRKYSPFKTHLLNLLLSYSGREDQIRNRFTQEWSLVGSWDPQSRYNPPVKATRANRAKDKAALKAKARQVIDSATILLRKI